jgi:hypothetical protein
MEILLTAIEHGALAGVMAVLWWHERSERIKANELVFLQLQKCLDEQEQLLDSEFGPDKK